MLNKKVALYNGVEIPVVGLGTWQIPDAVAEGAVRDAIETGYRHIDTAAAYENESGIGRGIKANGIAREKLFITSKVPAEYKTYELAKNTIEESLRLLDAEYIDLMLIHAPRPWDEMNESCTKTYHEENIAVWRAFEESYERGSSARSAFRIFPLPI